MEALRSSAIEQPQAMWTWVLSNARAVGARGRGDCVNLLHERAEGQRRVEVVVSLRLRAWERSSRYDSFAGGVIGFAVYVRVNPCEIR